jgi:Tfp pilus assembly protein PilF
MTKKLRDTLDEDQIKQRSQMMAILNLNLALVSIKQKNAAQIIKHSMEAIKIDPQNAKGHYRLY